MIKRETRNSIDIVTFNSPNGNMLSLTDIEYLSKYIEDAKNDNNIKGIILTGEGRCFSTGLDNSPLIENFSEEESNYFFKTFDKLLLNLFQFPKPIVAAVNGHSIGGGLLIQCCADYVVISENPKIKLGLPELKLGLTIDKLMKELIYFNLSNYKILGNLLYSAQYNNPQKYKEYGFVDELVPSEDLMNRCLIHIHTILSHDPKIFNITKQMIKSNCKEKMNTAFKNNCFILFSDLLKAKYMNNDKIS